MINCGERDPWRKYYGKFHHFLLGAVHFFHVSFKLSDLIKIMLVKSTFLNLWGYEVMPGKNHCEIFILLNVLFYDQ